MTMCYNVHIKSRETYNGYRLLVITDITAIGTGTGVVLVVDLTL